MWWKALRASLPLALLALTSQPAAPAASGENFNPFNQRLMLMLADPYIWLTDGYWNFLPDVFGLGGLPEAAAKPPKIRAATFKLNNFGATLEKGEPAESGKMKKTVWAEIAVPDNKRVVLHTFGSDFDTVLAVYTGAELNKLKRVAGNDDTPAGSHGKGASLVAFDAKKGVRYVVQIGSKSGAEGDIILSAFLLPPAGGITAFLVEALSNPNWYGRDLACGYGASGLPNCSIGPAIFLVHNATDKQVTVEAAHNLGGGIDAPGDFALKPGEVKAAEFTFTGGFDTTKTRTIAGVLAFRAWQGGKTVGESKNRMVVVVKPQAVLPDVLEAVATPIIDAGLINEPVAVDVELRNTGNKAATGCHARSTQFTHNKTVWENSGVLKPFDIAKGKSHVFRILVASQEGRVADIGFAGSGGVIIDCADTEALRLDLSNGFDYSARGAYELADLEARKLTKGDVLKVPRSGDASFEVEVENRGGEATVVARTYYGRPFDDAADALFAATVCRLDKPKGKCLGKAEQRIEYAAKKRAKDAFRVFVTAPKKDPGFDPEQRRIFLILGHKHPSDFADNVPVAAVSMAPQKQ